MFEVRKDISEKDGDVIEANSITRSPLVISLIRLGEGYNGDHDDTDPLDAELYRVDVQVEGDDQEYSLCTHMEVEAMTGNLKRRALLLFANNIEAGMQSGFGVKHTLSVLSWINVTDLEQCS